MADNLKVFDYATILILIGMISFYFEGIGLIIPTYDVAADKEKYTFVLGLAMFTTASIFSIVGILGYFAYGEDTKQIITENLPEKPLTWALIMSFCVICILTYPLQMFPVNDTLEYYIFGDSAEGLQEGKLRLKHNILRTALVVISIFIGWIFMNKLDKMAAIIGSLCGQSLGYIFPCMFYLKFECQKSKWDRYACKAIIVTGILLIIGTLVVTGINWND